MLKIDPKKNQSGNLLSKLYGENQIVLKKIKQKA
jgi:hypothetical protein